MRDEPSRHAAPGVEAFPTLVEQVRRTGLTAELTVEGPVEDIAAATGLSLLRIAQESVTNALRHAHASSIAINLAIAEGSVCLSVTDDGVGLGGARTDTLDAEGNGGHGVLGMQERAKVLGGTLDCASRRRAWRSSGRGRDALAQAAAAFDAARAVGTGSSGLLRVGLTPAVGPDDRAELVRALRAGSDRSVTLRNVRPGDLARSLRDRSVDLVLAGVTGTADDTLDRADLRRSRMQVHALAEHRLAADGSAKLADFDGERLLTANPPGTPYTDLLVRRDQQGSEIRPDSQDHHHGGADRDGRARHHGDTRQWDAAQRRRGGHERGRADYLRRHDDEHGGEEDPRNEEEHVHLRAASDGSRGPAGRDVMVDECAHDLEELRLLLEFDQVSGVLEDDELAARHCGGDLLR